MTASTSPAFEFFLQGASFGLRSTEVERVIEYEVSTPPFASPAVAGIGVHQDSLVVLVRVQGSTLPPAPDGFRRVRAALLVRPAKAGVRLAIEVSEVRSLVRLADGAVPPGGPDWLVPAFTEDGRAIPRVDVERFLATLDVPDAPTRAVQNLA